MAEIREKASWGNFTTIQLHHGCTSAVAELDSKLQLSGGNPFQSGRWKDANKIYNEIETRPIGRASSHGLLFQPFLGLTRRAAWQP